MPATSKLRACNYMGQRNCSHASIVVFLLVDVWQANEMASVIKNYSKFKVQGTCGYQIFASKRNKSEWEIYYSVNECFYMYVFEAMLLNKINFFFAFIIYLFYSFCFSGFFQHHPTVKVLQVIGFVSSFFIIIA